MKDIWMEKAAQLSDKIFLSLIDKSKQGFFTDIAVPIIAKALEEVARERDAERDDFHRDCRKTLNDLQKQLSEKEENLRICRDIISGEAKSNVDDIMKIASLEAEISRLKMLTDFPESSFKWRWAKAEEKIKELEAEVAELKNEYSKQLKISRSQGNEISSLEQKLEKAAEVVELARQLRMVDGSHDVYDASKNLSLGRMLDEALKELGAE